MAANCHSAQPCHLAAARRTWRFVRPGSCHGTCPGTYFAILKAPMYTMLTTDGMGHDGARNACSSDRHPDCTERPQGIYPPEHRAVTLKCHLSGGQAPDHALNRAMGANTSSWRLLLVPLTAVLTASLLFLLGERSRLFPRQNMSISQQRPCQSTDGLGSQQEGAAASVTAGTGAAWRKVADGQQFGPGERSYYASWIDRDLSRWSETGITQQVCSLLPSLLEDGGPAAAHAPSCVPLLCCLPGASCMHLPSGCPGTEAASTRPCAPPFALPRPPCSDGRACARAGPPVQYGGHAPADHQQHTVGGARRAALNWLLPCIRRARCDGGTGSTGASADQPARSAGMAHMATPDAAPQRCSPTRCGAWPLAPAPAGALSAAGRVPYFLLSLMEALALFPGQVPDVDLVFQPGGCSIFVAACCIATS